MKYQLFLLIIILFVWSCETKKRKHSQASSGIRSSNSGQTNDLSSISISENGSVQNLPDMRPRSTNMRQGRNNKKNEKKQTKLSRNSKRQSKSGNERNPNRRKSTFQDAFALERRKEVLRSTMRHMFGFEHMNAPRVPQATSIDVKDLDNKMLSNSRESISRDLLNSLRHKPSDRHRFLPNPPDFMLELYRTYSEDKSLMQINSKSQGNTIRSFFSVAGEAKNGLSDKGKPMIILPYFKGYRSTQPHNRGRSVGSSRNQMRVFAFNVTSIPPTESIVGSELRLNGLGVLAMQSGHDVLANDSNSRWSAMIAVYRVSEAEPTGNETRNVYQRLGSMVTIQPNSRCSWVDNNIANLATRARQLGHILIVKFYNENERHLNRRKRSSKRFRPNHSSLGSLMGDDSNLELPTYFVVMSDRSKRNTGVRPNPAFTSVQLSPILIVYCNDTTAEIVTSSPPQHSDDILRAIASRNVSTKLKRSRRSANQRLRDDVLAPPKESNEFPGESPQSETTTRAVLSNDRTEMHDNGRSERRVLQSLKDRKSISQNRKNKKRRRGRRCKKRGRKGKKSRKCRKVQKPTAEPSLNRAQQTCSRKSLHVDFGDMGWAEWIISPKSFDAYYCSGLCEFDTMKKAKPSNHAIIQAFIKAFGINNDVPAPCCVPEKLMSLSVLFFDQDGNVVLKVFPNMSVESCACR